MWVAKQNYSPHQKVLDLPFIRISSELRNCFDSASNLIFPNDTKILIFMQFQNFCFIFLVEEVLQKI